MVNTGVLSPEDVRKGQEKIKEEIYARAKELGISTDDLCPLPDGDNTPVFTIFIHVLYY